MGPPEIILISIVLLVLFGASRLPRLARSVGEASKEFKKGLADKSAPGEPVAGDDKG